MGKEQQIITALLSRYDRFIKSYNEVIACGNNSISLDISNRYMSNAYNVAIVVAEIKNKKTTGPLFAADSLFDPPIKKKFGLSRQDIINMFSVEVFYMSNKLKFKIFEFIKDMTDAYMIEIKNS